MVEIPHRHGIGFTPHDIGNGRQKGTIAATQQHRHSIAEGTRRVAIVAICGDDVEVAVVAEIPNRHGNGFSAHGIRDGG